MDWINLFLYEPVFRNRRNIFQPHECVEAVASVHNQNSTLYRQSETEYLSMPNDRLSSLNDLTMNCFLFHLSSPTSISISNKCFRSGWRLPYPKNWKKMNKNEFKRLATWHHRIRSVCLDILLERKDYNRLEYFSWCVVRFYHSLGLLGHYRSKLVDALPRNLYENLVAVFAYPLLSPIYIENKDFQKWNSREKDDHIVSLPSNWLFSVRPTGTSPWNIPGKTGKPLCVFHRWSMPATAKH